MKKTTFLSQQSFRTILDNYNNFAPMFKNEIYIMIGIKSKLSYGI